MGAEKQEEQGADTGMAGRATPAREKSSFAVTCSLLSQYLKDKKGGLQGLGGLGMAPPPPDAAGAFRPPTTMNLLSALDAPAAEEPNDAAKATTEEAKEHDQQTGENPREEEAQQLTIFYGGKVVVFDKFPSTKVKDLLQIVNAGGDRAGDTAAPQPSQNSLSDMPIARRNSLHRFLEKRKGRITAKAPYQVNSPVGVDASKQATGEKKSWLGLGQEVAVKQEI
ncbi:hypothetical protein SETIT_2G217500v2 [Setaria italica]|uniref:Protein TIFY n=1 Tax=Setaria italica TaxID=4555 RepID=K3ZWQ5_SETIT|nr:protein TIFY 10c [Setaria italica]RCV11827.1 hypothetical protein SETIT_2G217500v2 [Setaria italica]